MNVKRVQVKMENRRMIWGYTLNLTNLLKIESI
jgi:hypothetical protein